MKQLKLTASQILFDLYTKGELIDFMDSKEFTGSVRHDTLAHLRELILMKKVERDQIFIFSVEGGCLNIQYSSKKKKVVAANAFAEVKSPIEIMMKEISDSFRKIEEKPKEKETLYSLTKELDDLIKELSGKEDMLALVEKGQVMMEKEKPDYPAVLKIIDQLMKKL